jgi:hypothetical protein
MDWQLVGKRSSFPRIPRDFYPTPYAAVLPLLPHLQPETLFVEPCAGGGALISHLERHGHKCVFAYDIEPRRDGIARGDARAPVGFWTHAYITNPPWDRRLLHPIIENLSRCGPTWLLFDADWMHTRQSAPYVKWLHKIVSVGRVKWIEDSPFTGKDNCCWYLFDQTSDAPAQFVGRAA